MKAGLNVGNAKVARVHYRKCPNCSDAACEGSKGLSYSATLPDARQLFSSKKHCALGLLPCISWDYRDTPRPTRENTWRQLLQVTDALATI